MLRGINPNVLIPVTLPEDTEEKKTVFYVKPMTTLEKLEAGAIFEKIKSEDIKGMIEATKDLIKLTVKRVEGLIVAEVNEETKDIEDIGVNFDKESIETGNATEYLSQAILMSLMQAILKLNKMDTVSEKNLSAQSGVSQKTSTAENAESSSEKKEDAETILDNIDLSSLE